MAWDQSRSSKRVREQWKSIQAQQITVKKLTREMDLTNLSTNDVRIVHGAHLYVGVTNFSTCINDSTLRRENFKPLHRYLHVLRLEQRRIVQTLFDGDKIQVQGPKFHGLLYKPYDDDEKLAWRAVLMGATLAKVMRNALPEVFPDYPALSPVVGASLGDVVVANVGVRGDRELISIGGPANHAAKILGTANSLTVTKELWGSLSEKRRALFTKVDDNYTLGALDTDSLITFLKDEGITWSVQRSIDAMNGTVDALPLKDIESHEADVRIDLGALGPKHFKVANSGSVFVDIDGYTRLIDSLLGDEKKLAEAVKLLHLLRYELQQVAEADFDGVVIQHQGDRMQAILHLPKDDHDRIKRKLVDLCISLNSSVELVLNVDCVIFEPYHVSIGADYGKAVVVRSGARGDLDASCFGDEVLRAETLQLYSAGNEMRVSSGVFSAVADEHIREAFTHESARSCYVAKGLTWVAVEDRKKTKAYAASAVPAFNIGSRQVEFDKDGQRNHRPDTVPLKNTSNWAK